MKKIFLKSLAIFTYFSFASITHAEATSKTCSTIVDYYKSDLKQIESALNDMIGIQKTQAETVKEKLAELKNLFKKNPDNPSLKSLSATLKTVYDGINNDALQGAYDNFQAQIKSAGSRVNEWKEKNKSGATCDEMSCKEYYGCLLGQKGCPGEYKPQTCKK